MGRPALPGRRTTEDKAKLLKKENILDIFQKSSTSESFMTLLSDLQFLNSFLNLLSFVSFKAKEFFGFVFASLRRP